MGKLSRQRCELLRGGEVTQPSLDLDQACHDAQRSSVRGLEVDALAILQRTSEESTRAGRRVVLERLADEQPCIDASGVQVGAMDCAQCSQDQQGTPHGSPWVPVFELHLCHVEPEGLDACP